MKKPFYVILLIVFFAAGFGAAVLLQHVNTPGAKVEADGHTEAQHEEEGHDAHGEEGHAGESGVVKLSEESQAAAGFKYEKAKASVFTGVINATGQINSDAVITADILPDEAGVIEACGIMPGEKVTVGQELCVIKTISGVHPVKSTIDGTVTASYARPGAKADRITALHTVADMRKLNAVFNVNEKDISGIRIGQNVSVSNYEQQGTAYRGKVIFISPSVDEETRTIKVGVSIDNTGSRLKLGMFLKAEFDAAKQGTYILIPQEAAQYSGGKKIAFVKSGKEEFEMRELNVAGETPGFIAVSSGINAGEIVVAGGGFLLKSEFFKSKMGAGCAD